MDDPQAARSRFLQTLWPDMIDSWERGVTNIPAAQRALEAGARRDDLVTLAREVAYNTVFAMLVHLDRDWLLTEADTGQHLHALYEDLLTLDPSGNDGCELSS
jgi:hypothetical protein